MKMKVGKKDIILIVVIGLFLFTTIAFNYKEGVDRGEWITPGDENKDRYYNEHKISGNPEIDAIRYNHRAKKREYIDSNVNPTLYQLNPLPLTLPKPAEPIKQLTPEVWSDGLLNKRVDNPVTPQYRTSTQSLSSNNAIQVGNKRLIRKRRKKDK